MRVYQVKDWNKHFENNRSRERDNLSWVPIPNKHDSMTFARIMAEPDGAAIYGIWTLILQLLSKQCLPRAGWLTRDGTPAGTPWRASDIALPLRRPVSEIQRTIDFLSSGDIDWIESVEVITNMLVAPERTQVPTPCDTSPHKSALACEKTPPSGNGIEEKGNEVQGRECTSTSSPVDASENLSLEATPEDTKPNGHFRRSKTRILAETVLEHLNAKAGRSFRLTTENLDIIACRLEEIALDTAGVNAMIDRQVALWKGDPKMETFLRPETLFRKSKFSGYYDDRNQPVRATPDTHDIDHSKGF